MKNLLLAILLLSSINLLAQDEEINLKPFLPELLSIFPQVRDFAISSDGTQIFFTAESPKHDAAAIFYMIKTANGWSAPEIAPFSGQYRDIEPHFDVTSSRLYFSSNRPKNDTIQSPGDYDIYYVLMSQGSWSDPINIGEPINSSYDEFYPSISKSGILYFTASYEDTKGKEDIYSSTWTDGAWQIPINIGPMVNTETYDFNAFITPDDSVIIYTAYRLPGGLGGGDLYISKRDATGNWQKAKQLKEPINSKGLDYCPYLDLKNNKLYFTSDRSMVNQWQKEKLNTADFIKELTQYNNGMSRIYSVPFDIGDYFK